MLKYDSFRPAVKYKIATQIDKFILLIKKGVYPYEYIDSSERFDEASLLIKKLCIVNYILKRLLIKTIHLLKKYLKNLALKFWVNIMIYMFKVIRYCLQIYLKILEINVLKDTNLILLIFYLHLD